MFGDNLLEDEVSTDLGGSWLLSRKKISHFAESVHYYQDARVA